jgi:hypothetical protein
MYEYLQILSLALSFIGMLPEFYQNIVYPENSTYGQLPLYVIWLSSTISSTIYVIVNNIDLLVSINTFSNMTFFTIVMCMKLYNIQICNYKNQIIMPVTEEIIL